MTQAAGRTLQLLEIGAQADGPLGLMDFVARSGQDKSTCLRALRYLESRDFLVRDPLTRRYAAGPALLALSASALRGSDLRRVLRPHLEAIRDETRETVALHVRVRDHRVCIDGIESRQDVRRVVPLGESFPLVSGPAGKVILAALPTAEVEQLLGALEGSARDLVRSQVDEIRSLGYMVAVSDRTVGVSALAAPFFAGDLGSVASVTIAGPADRWTEEHMRAYAETLTRRLAEVSQSLGLEATG